MKDDPMPTLVQRFCVIFPALLITLYGVVPAQAADAAPAAKIQAIEGVYKKRFTNGIIGEGKAPGEADQAYQSEDVVEIVRHDDTRIYFRAELAFYNGHSCGISGMAAYEQGAFIYREAAPLIPGETPCTLRIDTTKDKLRLTDRPAPGASASCRMYCGARGSLSDYEIPLSSRRKIRYMDRLLKSPEYRRAVENLAH